MENRFLRVLARRMVIPVAQRLLIPSFAGIPRKLGAIMGLSPLPPKRVLNSSEWAAKEGNGRLYQDLCSETIIERAPAYSLNSEPDWRIQEAGIISNPATFVVTLPNGRLVGASGAVVTEDETLLADLSPDWFLKSEAHPIRWRLKLPPIRRLEGTYATLARLSGWNYAHWVLDALPRLQLLHDAGVRSKDLDGFILNGPESAWKSEMLDMLGIPADKRVFLTSGDHYQCEKLVVPSYACPAYGFTSRLVGFLQEVFPPTPARGDVPSRIYIARGKAAYRRVTNESEVIRLLERHGFQAVYCEELSFRQKVDLFSSVEAVVAAHGAGMTHLAFCRRGTGVLEIFSPCYVNPSFWALSDAAGLRYSYMMGDGPKPPKGRDPHAAEEDVTVSLSSLEKALKSLELA